MGILNFLIVLAFNLYWYRDGKESFIKLYNFGYTKWLSIFVWVYAIWGIVNLLTGIHKLIY